MIIEEHTQCKCDCRIKEQDCNRFQKYDKSQCKCYCQNTDEQHKCLQVSLKFFHDLNGLFDCFRPPQNSLLIVLHVYCSNVKVMQSLHCKLYLCF